MLRLFALCALAASVVVALPSGSVAADPAQGQSVVFIRDTDPPGKRSSLQVLNLTTHTARRLLKATGSIGDVAVSPNGAQVAYSVFGGRAGDELRVVSITGTGDRLVTRADNRHTLVDVAWTPDGKTLLYDSGSVGKKGRYRRGSGEIYSVAVADGAAPKRLTHDHHDDATPAVFPDGRTIVFSRQRSRRSKALNADLFTMGIDGSGMKRLTNDKAEEYSPVVSPDGKQIALERCICNLIKPGAQQPPRKFFSVQVVDSKGGGRRTVAASKGNDSAPAWSPDGTGLVFASDRADNKADKDYYRDQLYTVDETGGGGTRLLKSGFGDHNPVFG